MNREIPTINKIIQYHDLKRNWHLHQSKLKNIKPTLTTRNQNDFKQRICLNKTAKQPFGNSFNRMIDIQFENKALLKKLTQKKIQKPTNNPNCSFQNSLNPTDQPYKLPKNNRKRYFQQHQRRLQNQGILKRIKDTKPLYQMQKYMTQRKMTQKYINSISKFGYKHYKPNKTILNYQVIKDIKRNQSTNHNKVQNQFTNKDKYNSYDKGYYQQDEQIELKKSKLKYVSLNKLNEKNIKGIRVLPKKVNTNFNSKDNHEQKQNRKQRDYRRIQYDAQQLQSNVIKNNSSLFKADKCSRFLQNSHQNMQNHPLNTISQREIKINGLNFILKGSQYVNRIKLEILQIKSKSLGSNYIHEVQIPSVTYFKKFQGRIDLLIKSLNFDKESQVFYIN